MEVVAVLDEMFELASETVRAPRPGTGCVLSGSCGELDEEGARGNHAFVANSVSDLGVGFGELYAALLVGEGSSETQRFVSSSEEGESSLVGGVTGEVMRGEELMPREDEMECAECREDEGEDEYSDEERRVVKPEIGG